MTPIDNCLLDIATQMSSTLPKPHNSLTKGILFSLLLLLILFTLLSSCSLLPCIFQVQKCPVFFDSSLLVSHSQLVTKFCWLCLLPILNICSIIFILLLLPQIRSSIFTWAIAVFSWLQFSWLGSLLDIPHSISFFPKHTQIYHFLAPKSLMVPNVCKTKPKHLRLAPKDFHGLGPSCPLNFPLFFPCSIQTEIFPILHKACTFLDMCYFTSRFLYLLDTNLTALACFKEQSKKHFLPWSFPSEFYHFLLWIPTAFSSPTKPISFSSLYYSCTFPCASQ